MPYDDAVPTGRVEKPARAIAWATTALLAALYVHTVAVASFGTAENRATDDRLLVGEIAGGRALSQTFFMEAAGLDRITIFPTATGEPADTSVRFELFLYEPGVGISRLFRIERPVVEVLAGPRYDLTFPPLPSPRGRRFRLEVSVPGSTPGHGIGLWGRRSAGYTDGVLVVGGRQQWGDLEFETGASRATVYGNVRHLWLGGPWPRLAGVGTVLFLAAVGLVLLGLPWALLSAGGHAETVPPEPEPALGTSASLVRAFLIGVPLLLVASFAATGAASRVTSIEPDAIDLIARFDGAEKRTTRPLLADAFEVLDEVDIPGGPRRAIFAHPFSRITWNETIPERAVLRTAAALLPHAWKAFGDGAVFRVGISDGPTYTEYFRRQLDPYARPADRAWIEIEIDLSPYAGREVGIVFNTEPGQHGNAVSDAAVWGAPRIVPRR